MSEVSEFFVRLDALIAEKGLSDRALSMLVTDKPDLVRDMRRHKRLPSGNSLISIAHALDTSVDYLVHGDQHTGNVRLADISLAYQPERPQQNLPVLGTAHGGTVILTSQKGDTEVEQTLFEPTQVIRYVLRPRALIGVKEAYAIYVEGDSMIPRFGPGEMAVVDPRVPPRIGDDVIVQLSHNGDDEISAILIKRLVRSSASYIELEQFNPAAVFRVDKRRVKRIHRIMTQGDLLS